MRFAGIKLSNYMDSPDFTTQARQVVASQSKERQADSTATWMGQMAESKGAADYEMAQAGAASTRAQGAAAGQSAAFGGVMDGIGQIGGAAIKGGKIPGLGPKPTPSKPTPQLNTGYGSGLSSNPYNPYGGGGLGGITSYTPLSG